MLNIPLWKRVIIWGLCALGVIMTAPNLFYTQVERHNDAVAAIEAAGGVATPEQEAEAVARLERLRAELDDALGDRILLLPSAPTVAPRLDDDAATLESVRVRTLSITAVAGITGRPALSVPALTVDGLPVGLCLVGPRGSDLDLIDLALASFTP